MIFAEITYNIIVFYAVALYIGLLLCRPDILDRANRIEDRPLFTLYKEYDFIIVGGGSAGCVIANRLSENPQWTVLLLEAGGEEPVLSEIPLLYPTLQLSSLDWKFQTEFSSTFCLNQNGRSNWPRGKVIGGSSVLNAMLYIRGNRRDYDRWEKLGNEGWSYDDVLPYFKKSEDMKIPELQNSPYHGTGGYLTVESLRYQSKITDSILNAGKEVGYDVTDLNGESQCGFTKTQGTLRDGLRCSTAKAFLRPVKTRKNLHISLYSNVFKLIINNRTKTVVGVQFQKLGLKRIIRARKEVIVCGGSIKSPQILMLSGIGPSDHLLEKGIEPIVHSPGVGKNLQDHVAMGGITFLFDSPLSMKPIGAGVVLPRFFTWYTFISFLKSHEGPIYSLPFCELIAFVNSKYNDNPAWPDIQFIIATGGDNDDGGLFNRRTHGLNKETFDRVFKPILYKDAFTVVPLILRPKSVGRIILRNKNPLSQPLIYPNYFDNPYDIKILVRNVI